MYHPNIRGGAALKTSAYLIVGVVVAALVVAVVAAVAIMTATVGGKGKRL